MTSLDGKSPVFPPSPRVLLASASSAASLSQEKKKRMRRGKFTLSTEEVEKLIELVRRHPCLYDPRSADHKDAQKMVNTWTSVSQIMEKEGMGGEYKLFQSV